ncbi:Not CCR4-Not complex component [Conidiobolus coronatus NRRL 28638]|uniref:Not CCR4-Not complex component n=1 Tax=Conidiobolus coronatus (strain ATCC 28846 / CBS 209.66 / NRRL 28638) TaxID=796925 RepID=A0A137NWG2_CONC2|nr:Not CCR4-Not complex component [Conidiobolus coronatus NRRL 28638]|eukprot:KXN67175.1 Not CCR4-Not complex component [Conidiobolus coronatus NRRL 28638]
MTTRKLQLEIDRVLKKVTEGFNDFDVTYSKIQTTTNSNMSQKYESDLKKEIKKLQRCRDQIKTWLTSNDIKDKRQLTDSRKAIENKMEQFKLIEKEMKTKAFSKEGLNQATKVDPREQKKSETVNWISEVVDNLNIQIDSFEAESEVLLSGSKKKKDASKIERLNQIKHHLERHKWHINRLELIQRLLENDRTDTDAVF